MQRDKAGTPPARVKSVLRACEIMALFEPTAPTRTLAGVAKATGLSKTTAHRILGTLEAAGFVTKTNGNYRPTLMVFRIGSVASLVFDIRQEAHDALIDLADEYGDTAYLMVAEGSHALCVERIDGDSSIKIMTLDVGKSLPLDRGAGPTAILAHREEDLLPRLILERDLPEGFPDAAFRRRLERIRSEGYSVIWHELAQGAAAVGAPVFDLGGKAIAAISLGGPADNFRGPKLERIIHDVKAAAGSVSRRLGYVGADSHHGAE